MKYADLHLHTLFSDGTSAPEDLVSAAKKAGLSAIAVVDHDTVLGLDAALAAARKVKLEVLPGIELSAEYDGLEIHMLGYLIDHKNPALVERLNFLRNNRIARIHKIVGKLNDLGVELKPETVLALANNGTVGRLHIARSMVKEGIVDSVYEAFKKYIGDKSPAYVLDFKLSPQEAIALIKSAGGITVLAHPYILNRDDLIPLFVEWGLDGLEAYYPEHTASMVKTYLTLAKKFHLCTTGGSDFHGEAKPDVRLGDFKVPYAVVERIKAQKNKK